MSAYDGVTVRIKSTVTDFDNNPVTDAEVTSATVEVLDSSGNYVPLNGSQSAALTWNSTQSYWYYDWQNALPGTFLAVCTFNGVEFEVYDYGTVRVKPKKLIPTGTPTTITG